MSKMKIIQFGRLEEFTAEDLSASNSVRVVILDISKSMSSQMPRLRQVSVGVHVRTINDAGHILACYLPVARLQLYNGLGWPSAMPKCSARERAFPKERRFYNLGNYDQQITQISADYQRKSA